MKKLFLLASMLILFSNCRGHEPKFHLGDEVIIHTEQRNCFVGSGQGTIEDFNKYNKEYYVYATVTIKGKLRVILRWIHEDCLKLKERE